MSRRVGPHPTGLGWPPPPYPLVRSRRVMVAASWFLALFCPGVAIGIVVLVFGVSDIGRLLLVDTGLWLGLGEPIERAVVVVDGCSRQASTGRPRWSHERCVVRIVVPGAGKDAAVTEGEIAVSAGIAASELRAAVRGAGMVLGMAGARWPASVILDRWFQWLPVFVALVLLGALTWFAAGTLLGQRRLARAAQRGAIVPADLLYADEQRSRYTAQPALRWRFAWREAGGRQRLARAWSGGAPLALDPAITAGAALIGPENGGWLIHDSLAPLALPGPEATLVLGQARARQAARHPRLAPLQGEPEDAAERLAAAEAALAGGDPGRAFVLALRLGWTAADDATFDSAQALRHRAGRRLGPKAALQALDAARQGLAPSPPDCRSA